MISIILAILFTIISQLWIVDSVDSVSPYPYTEEDKTLFVDNIASLREFMVDKIQHSKTNDREKTIHGIFIRALFHDCANCYIEELDAKPFGCCDGCVDYNEPFNQALEQRGFEGYSDTNWKKYGLKQWQEQWIHNDINNENDIFLRSKWTRADFMAACSNIAIEFSIMQKGGIENFNKFEPDQPPLTYPHYYFGRRDCDKEEGTYAHPDPKYADREHLYFLDAETDIWQNAILDFFDQQFGLNNEQSVALFAGGHNIANAHNEEDFDIGIQAPWTYRHVEWDNQYPRILYEKSWTQIAPNPSESIKIYQYDMEEQTNPLNTMLTADISMVYNIKDFMNPLTGAFTGCVIQGSKDWPKVTDRCPYLTVNGEQISNMAQIRSYYEPNKPKHDIDPNFNGDFKFLRDFLDEYNKMQINGYNIGDLVKVETSDTNIPSPTLQPTKYPTPQFTDAPTEVQSV